MSIFNLKIARQLSRKQHLKFWALAKKKGYYEKLQMHLTFTNHNIFVNLTNGLGETFYVSTFGLIGYTGMRRKTRYALYYYGLSVGEKIKNFLKQWKKKTISAKTRVNISLVLRTISVSHDFRFKRFWDGFKKYGITFTNISYASQIAYNGCRLSSSRRTRRLRRYK